MDKRYIANRLESGWFGVFDIKRSQSEPVAALKTIDADLAHRIADLLNQHGAAPKAGQ